MGDFSAEGYRSYTITPLFMCTRIVQGEPNFSCNKGFFVSKKRFLIIRAGIRDGNLHHWYLKKKK